MTTDQVTPLRIDYHKINPHCYVCGEDSEVVRITAGSDGELYVATLCEKHARGEQEHIHNEHEDLQLVVGTGTFVNMAANSIFNKVFEEAEEDIEARLKELNK
jgi:hypothetical protein